MAVFLCVCMNVWLKWNKWYCMQLTLERTSSEGMSLGNLYIIFAALQCRCFNNLNLFFMFIGNGTVSSAIWEKHAPAE